MTDEPLDPLSKFMREREEYAKRVEEAMRKAALENAARNPDIYNPDGTRKTPKRCEATTRKGLSCKRKPEAGSVYCRQHRNHEEDDGFSTYRGW